ncbi:MAG: hypothetical protein ABEI78_01440 [Candidatus Nanohaloarchaea archaeon]
MAQSTLQNLKNGQVFEPDFVASLALFLIIIGVFMSQWNTIMKSKTQLNQVKEIRENAERTTTLLASTPGYPNDWDKNNVKVVIPGFTNKNGYVISSKLAEFHKLTYKNQTDLLQAQNFYLKITHGGEPLTINGKKTIYCKKSSDPETLIPIERDILINQSGTIKTGKLIYRVYTK